jgi:hypothetical protein
MRLWRGCDKRKENPVIGIIFEVTPHPDHVSDYMEIAASLKPELEQMGGFISMPCGSGENPVPLLLAR